MPQGSVLDPLFLFLSMTYNPFIFADHTKCLYLIRSVEDTEKLQTDINNAAKWSCLSDLLFKKAKFVHLRFCMKTTDHPTYAVNRKPIKQLLQHKDRGVTFSRDYKHS